jgi:hypothetical protein
MIEEKKDLFSYLFDKDTDAICITTNPHYTEDGIAIMGGGCAGEAARRWTEVPKNLGKFLKSLNRNVPYIIGATDNNGHYLEPTSLVIQEKSFKCLIFSFPTINSLIQGSDLNLIKNSAAIMVHFANRLHLKKIILGRPGVGIGGLFWSDVKPVLEDILDDRFIIVSFDHEE